MLFSLYLILGKVSLASKIKIRSISTHARNFNMTIHIPCLKLYPIMSFQILQISFSSQQRQCFCFLIFSLFSEHKLYINAVLCHILRVYCFRASQSNLQSFGKRRGRSERVHPWMVCILGIVRLCLTSQT